MSMPRARRLAPSMLCLAALGAGISGCAATATARSDGLYATPMGNAPVTTNATPYSNALTCLRDYAARGGRAAPHIAVGRISDMTGKLEDNGGRAVTQGAPLMAMSALAKAGAPLVERYETDVARVEYKLADNKLISDFPLEEAGPDGQRPYRPIYAGTMSGSDFFVTGGITELNANIRTGQGNVAALQKGSTIQLGGIAGADYVLNVALDLRLVNTKTLDVVDIVSYQKQIIGRQVGAGLFSFFGSTVVNIAGEGAGEEPVHLAVRSMIERAVLEMMGRVYDLPATEACLSPGGDPLGDPTRPAYAAAVPASVLRPTVAPAAYELPPPPPPPATLVVEEPRRAPPPDRTLTWPSRR